MWVGSCPFTITFVLLTDLNEIQSLDYGSLRVIDWSGIEMLLSYLRGVEGDEEKLSPLSYVSTRIDSFKLWFY